MVNYVVNALALAVTGASVSIFKNAFLLVLLGVLAWIDYREKIIPNKYLLLGALYRILLLPVEWLHGKDISFSLFAGLVAVVLTGVLLNFSKCIIKNGIGAGDIKLFMLIAFYVGIEEIWMIMFFSMLIFLVSGCRKGAKGEGENWKQIPMAPSIALGTMLGIML